MASGYHHYSSPSEDFPGTLYIPDDGRYLSQVPFYTVDTRPMQRYLQEPELSILRNGALADYSMPAYQDGPRHRTVECFGIDEMIALPQQHYPSPHNSGQSSSCSSSNVSEPEWSPHASPHIRLASFTPEAFPEHPFHGFEDYSTFQYMGGYRDDHCVALHDLQLQETFDVQPEPLHLEEHQLAYGYHPQEVMPMQQAPPTPASTPPSQACGSETECIHSDEPAPVIRHRRANSSRSPTSATRTPKISKRQQNSRRHSSQPKPSKKDLPTDITVTRGFPCPFTPYGCTHIFGSKNEWKRHVTTQHLNLGYWRCDLCPAGKLNDFNRKDLFVQHVRRMHSTIVREKKSTSTTTKPLRGARKSSTASIKHESLLSSASRSEAEAEARIERRCYKKLRDAPGESGCIFCDEVFTCWEKRMEHVGRHMESACEGDGCVTDPGSWRVDGVTEEWMVGQGLVERRRVGLVLVE
ncbi:hypothetical protein LTR62_005063 [Meristemomyces frigidus]|uniref:C2H2-type domain-containing protein n=1 Tax=Meristemomyces frigidus TaxID=1508187 RepID=A0AAN7TJ19_9PEZI|nr:hypothetical protein LTR62_005063 [Meristemomyces frigidus]